MDEAKLNEFMGKLVVDMGGAAIMANVILGEELGLYRAMADGNPVSPEQLAERTSCNARLVREWLSGEAASGYVGHDQGRFRLPEEQAMALAQEDRRSRSPAEWSCLPACTSTGTRWSPRCAATVALARPITIRACSPAPNAFSGLAIAPPGQRMAADARRRGVPARTRCQGRRHRLRSWCVELDHGEGISEVDVPWIRFSRPLENRAGAPAGGGCRRRRPGRSHPGNCRDSRAAISIWCCFFDCLHDMGDPVGAAKRAHEALKPGGTVLLVEPFANDDLDENLNPVAGLFYAASTCICTPTFCHRSQAGLGAQAGERRLQACLR